MQWLHLELLLLIITDTVIIGYDQDSAGQDATLRGLDILSTKGLNVKVLRLDHKDVKDPDEYINKYGVERFKNCLKNSISLVEFKIEKLESSLNINDMDQKVKLLTDIASILANIENNIERQMYIDKIATKYNIGSGPILKEVEKRLKKSIIETVSFDSQIVNKKMQMIADIKKRYDEYIIALLLSKNKSIQNIIFEKVKDEDIADEVVKKLYQEIKNISINYDISKVDILSKIKDEALIKELTDIMYIDISDNKEKLLNEVLLKKQKENLIFRREEIIKKLDTNISKDESEILNVELNQIIVELSKM